MGSKLINVPSKIKSSMHIEFNSEQTRQLLNLLVNGNNQSKLIEVTGLKQSGKSTWLSQVIREHNNTLQYDAVVWVDCSTAHSLTQSLYQCLKDLKFDEQQLSHSNLAQLFAEFYHYSRHSESRINPKKWLLIFDQLEPSDRKVIEECLRLLKIGVHIVYTTQKSILTQFALDQNETNSFEIEPLTLKVAKQCLANKFPSHPLTLTEIKVFVSISQGLIGELACLSKLYQYVLSYDMASDMASNKDRFWQILTSEQDKDTPNYNQALQPLFEVIMKDKLEKILIENKQTIIDKGSSIEVTEKLLTTLAYLILPAQGITKTLCQSCLGLSNQALDIQLQYLHSFDFFAEDEHKQTIILLPPIQYALRTALLTQWSRLESKTVSLVNLEKCVGLLKSLDMKYLASDISPTDQDQRINLYQDIVNKIPYLDKVIFEGMDIMSQDNNNELLSLPSDSINSIIHACVSVGRFYYTYYQNSKTALQYYEMGIQLLKQYLTPKGLLNLVKEPDLFKIECPEGMELLPENKILMLLYAQEVLHNWGTINSRVLQGNASEFNSKAITPLIEACHIHYNLLSKQEQMACIPLYYLERNLYRARKRQKKSNANTPLKINDEIHQKFVQLEEKITTYAAQEEANKNYTRVRPMFTLDCILYEKECLDGEIKKDKMVVANDTYVSLLDRFEQLMCDYQQANLADSDKVTLLNYMAETYIAQSKLSKSQPTPQSNLLKGVCCYLELIRLCEDEVRPLHAARFESWYGRTFQNIGNELDEWGKNNSSDSFTGLVYFALSLAKEMQIRTFGYHHRYVKRIIQKLEQLDKELEQSVPVSQSYPCPTHLLRQYPAVNSPSGQLKLYNDLQKHAKNNTITLQHLYDFNKLYTHTLIQSIRSKKQMENRQLQAQTERTLQTEKHLETEEKVLREQQDKQWYEKFEHDYPIAKESKQDKFRNGLSASLIHYMYKKVRKNQGKDQSLSMTEINLSIAKALTKLLPTVEVNTTTGMSGSVNLPGFVSGVIETYNSYYQGKKATQAFNITDFIHQEDSELHQVIKVVHTMTSYAARCYATQLDLLTVKPNKDISLLSKCGAKRIISYLEKTHYTPLSYEEAVILGLQEKIFKKNLMQYTLIENKQHKWSIDGFFTKVGLEHRKLNSSNKNDTSYCLSKANRDKLKPEKYNYRFASPVELRHIKDYDVFPDKEEANVSVEQARLETESCIIV